MLSVHSPFEGKRIRLSGTLLTDPKEYGDSLLVNLHGYTFFIPQDPALTYGSHIQVEGVVEKNDLKSVKLITVVPASSLLSQIRQRILKNMHSSLPDPESSLLAGMTVGAPNIPKTFVESLRKSGTSHIVVASGGNLAILAGFLESFLAHYMKRKVFLQCIAIILLIYSALTGFGAPIVRALIMWLILMTAQLLGRPTKQLYILSITILLMLFIKPQWVTDVSFQLSVGATLGIVLLSSRIQKRLRRLSFIKEALSTSVAAQIGILPVSIFVFHEVNILSPLWNALVLWTVPYITIIGMIGSLFSLLFIPLGKVIYLVSYPFTWYFVHVISL